MAQPHEADGATRELAPHEGLSPLALPLPQRSLRFRDALGQRQHHGKGVLRDTFGVAPAWLTTATPAAVQAATTSIMS